MDWATGELVLAKEGLASFFFFCVICRNVFLFFFFERVLFLFLNSLFTEGFEGFLLFGVRLTERNRQTEKSSQDEPLMHLAILKPQCGW